MTQTPATIDLTPTWESLIPAMFAVLENPKASYDAKQTVREELLKVARSTDAMAELMKAGRLHITAPADAK